MSSNDVIPFKFEEQTIRVVNLNGEPWFVTADVCAVLGLLPHRGGHSHHLTKLKADERRITPRSDIGVSGKGGAISLISEPGLYKLILRSDKPNARTFQDWVTREVLPTIRKTGEYRVPRKGLSRLCLDDAREARLSWELATTIAAGVGLKGNQLLIAANRYTRKVLGIDMLETMGVPLLPAPEPEVLLTATDIGQQLGGLTAQRVNELLEHHSFQKRVRDHKGRLHWEPTDKGLKAGGHMVEVERSNKTGEARQLRWASSIVQALREAMLPKPSTDDLPPAQGALL